jgi:hypothetical protein
MKKYLLALFLLIPSIACAGYKVTGDLQVTGKAGIGQAAGTEVLEVTGTAKATEFVGGGTGITGVVLSTEKGAASGVATLDGDSKVTASQLPASLTGSLTYKGVLDASGGAYPVGPTTGDYYVISVAGTIGAVDYSVGDWAVCNSGVGGTWDKVDNSVPNTGWTVGTGKVTLTTGANNVGINVADPTTKLDVGGTVNATAFTGGNLTGNSSTATALAANGANCSAGQAPLGVDASGAVEGCWTPTGVITSISGTTPIAVTSGATPVVSISATPTFTTVTATTFSGALTGNVTGNVTGAVTGNASSATQLNANPTDCSVAGTYATAIDNSGNLTCSTPAGSGVSGLGVNYVPKASDSTTLVDSSIYDNGTNVGIGTTTLTQKLTVNGSVAATSFVGNVTGTAAGLAADGANCSTGYSPLGVGTDGAAQNCFLPGNWTSDYSTKVTNTYKVGIGNASPTYELDVDGTIYSSGDIISGGSAERISGATYSTNYIDFDASATIVTVEPNVITSGNAKAATMDTEHIAGITHSTNYVDLDDSATKVKIEPGIISTGDVDVDGDIYGDILYGATLQLSGTGNVGIGVASPSHKLAVDGTIYFNPASLSADGGGGSKLGINVDGTIYKY